MRETRYYADPFQAPAWRAQWVEPIEEESHTCEMASKKVFHIDHRSDCEF